MPLVGCQQRCIMLAGFRGYSSRPPSGSLLTIEPSPVYFQIQSKWAGSIVNASTPRTPRTPRRQEHVALEPLEGSRIIVARLPLDHVDRYLPYG